MLPGVLDSQNVHVLPSQAKSPVFCWLSYSELGELKRKEEHLSLRKGTKEQTQK